MPYYFGSTIEGWARTCFEEPLNDQELRNSDVVYFVDDMMGWMEKNYGEEGDCEDERNPKSNRETYERFPPKATDQTKIGKWLRNYMDFADITEQQIQYNIYDTIYENISLISIEKLFHSLDTDDQREFCDYVSSDDRFSDESDNYISDEPMFSNSDMSESEPSDSEVSDSEVSDNEEEEDDDDYSDMPELEDAYTDDEYYNENIAVGNSIEV